LNSNRSEPEVDLLSLPTVTFCLLLPLTPFSASPQQNEILSRLNWKSAEEKRKKLHEETLSLGGYNAYSRPRPSTDYPNRSVFLDTKVNNFSPSKTRSELLQKVRVASIPHESYDIVSPLCSLSVTLPSDSHASLSLLFSGW
jgi:hypothetical protein